MQSGGRLQFKCKSNRQPGKGCKERQQKTDTRQRSRGEERGGWEGRGAGLWGVYSRGAKRGNRSSARADKRGKEERDERQMVVGKGRKADEKGEGGRQVAHPQSSHRRLSDNDFGIPQAGPDDLNEALDMHIEDRRRILCHLTQNEHSCIASVALALSPKPIQ